MTESEMDDTENWKQRKVFKKQTENNSMNKVDGFFRLLSDKKFTGYSSDF
jgi:hypothetical protein